MGCFETEPKVRGTMKTEKTGLHLPTRGAFVVLEDSSGILILLDFRAQMAHI
jgi:hypothetical protein